MSPDAVAARTVEVTVSRADLIRYAGAATDFNTVHWSESAARATGLPTVIAHGMLIMGIAVRVADACFGGDALVLDTAARFRRPFPVYDGEAVILSVTATPLAPDGLPLGDTVVDLVGRTGDTIVLTGTCRLRVLTTTGDT